MFCQCLWDIIADLSPCTGCYKLPVVDIVRWSCSSSAI